MSAPKPLPKCPVPGCGRVPREWHCTDVEAWGVICNAQPRRAANDHEIYVIKPTRRQARAAWRRLAGGRK